MKAVTRSTCGGAGQPGRARFRERVPRQAHLVAHEAVDYTDEDCGSPKYALVVVDEGACYGGAGRFRVRRSPRDSAAHAYLWTRHPRPQWPQGARRSVRGRYACSAQRQAESCGPQDEVKGRICVAARHCEEPLPSGMAQQEGLESLVPACRSGDRAAQRDLLRYLRRTNVRGTPAAVPIRNVTPRARLCPAAAPGAGILLRRRPPALACVVAGRRAVDGARAGAYRGLGRGRRRSRRRVRAGVAAPVPWRLTDRETRGNAAGAGSCGPMSPPDAPLTPPALQRAPAGGCRRF